MLPGAKYTAIKRDKYPVELPIDFINQAPVERYFNAIIIWEGYRIKETLLRNAECREDDDLTRNDVKETLKQLQRVSGAAFEINDKKIHPALNIHYGEVPPEEEYVYDMVHRIYRFLWQYTFKLYYEIAIVFADILKPEDVDPVRDFYNNVLEMFPKKYNIEYSKESKQDLIGIKQYIKYNLQEPEIAKKLISKIRKEINSLKDNPEVYAIIDDDIIKKLEIRKLIVDNYIVFYRIKDNNIQIVRVMYGRRNWINLL